MSHTILVVDDEKRLVSLLEAYLSQEGFRVVTAGNGREALFIARDEKPDLIISELEKAKDDEVKVYDLVTREYVEPISAGIVDPTKVVRCALENAASVAGVLITTDHAIIEK